jgi:hypothetical protein
MKLARVAATLVALTVLTACSDDPEPKTEPSESPTSEETTAPSQSGEQLIEDFVTGVSASLSTGDPSPFLALSASDCGNCQKLADNLHEGYRDGGRIVGGSWRVSKARLEQTTSDGDVWYVDVRSSRERWLDSEGALVKVVDAGLQLFAFQVRSSSGDLLVADLRVRA